jgi:hypothetical protein
VDVHSAKCNSSIARGICEIFTFVHGPDPALGPIDRDYLVPKVDPFDAVLAEWRQQEA